MNKLYEYPFSPKFLSLGPHRMARVDEGEGPAVVMVHGNPSWSYLYRNVISALKKEYRCLAPDHMGCGFSDKPQSYPYRLQTHIDNLERLLDHCNIERCVLMVHDWGGAVGMGWAGRHPERISGLVVLNTAAFRSSRLPFRIAVCRWPYLGALLVRGLNGFARAAIRMAVVRPMDPRVARGFLFPYDSWESRVAIHGFVRDIPMHAGHPSYETLKEVEENLVRLQDKPMLICWGGQDFCFNRIFHDQWLERFPGARSRYFEDGSHYVLEDKGPEVLGLLQPFLRSCHG